MPKYSVIVPVYKAENTIQKCVDSILKQPYQDFQLLLVDDCSPDRSFEICHQYQKMDKRVIALRQEKNKGVSAARNLGLKYATGEYILFVDSDDYVADTYLKTIDGYISQQYDLFSFGNYVHTVKSDGNIEITESSMNINIPTDSDEAAKWEKYIVQSFFASPCNKVYKSEIINREEIRFDEKCVCFEDLIFNLTFSRFVKNFSCIPDPLYYYRVIEQIDPISKRKWGTRFEISRKVSTAIESFIEGKKSNSSIFNIRRYTYAAFITELKAAKRDGALDGTLAEAVRDKDFQMAISSIRPKGRTLRVVEVLMKMKAYKTASFVIRKMMAN